MAENAVYLTSVEHSKPTIFEIWAEESFMATLQPAFHLLCNFIKTKYPYSSSSTPLKIIFKWPDESFMVFNAILQYTYLDWFSSSFSESFYGLKRVNVSSPNNRLSAKAKIISLIGLVGVPYASAKLKTVLDHFIFNSSGSSTGNSSASRFLQSYKTVNAVFNLIKLYHYLSYLRGTNSQHSVFHRLAQVQLVRQNQPAPSWFDILSLLRYETNKSKLLGPLTFKIIAQILEFSAFSLQFINWWNSSDSDALQFNKPVIPDSLESCDTGAACPICQKCWKVEVALSTSGIVYCYSCITKVLTETGRCPVTDLPFTADDLIRLYPSVN